jgi:hypothetical protein
MCSECGPNLTLLLYLRGIRQLEFIFLLPVLSTRLLFFVQPSAQAELTLTAWVHPEQHWDFPGSDWPAFLPFQNTQSLRMYMQLSLCII